MTGFANAPRSESLAVPDFFIRLNDPRFDEGHALTCS